MGKLIDLPGISCTEIECEFFNSVEQVQPILDKKIAATTAASWGAINIWKDDSGDYRCKAMRHRETISSARFSEQEDMEDWTEKWLDKISKMK